MYDTRLVNAAQEGDEAAFAALYDRNVEAVYDLCWALIGDEAEASRIVIDTFTLAARHLTDLTDASQLRPWLLAIARDRVLTEDEAGTLRSGWAIDPPAGSVATDEPLSTNDLRNWVREAGATVALADQVVVELVRRHNLDPGELAAAIGCEPEDVDRIIEQVSGEVGAVLGALVVARQGRPDCPELAAALQGWNGVPSVESAELAVEHIPGCEVCSARLAATDPLGLLGAALPVSPPADLRTQVLDQVAEELAAFRPRPRVDDPGAGRRGGAGAGGSVATDVAAADVAGDPASGGSLPPDPGGPPTAAIDATTLFAAPVGGGGGGPTGWDQSPPAGGQGRPGWLPIVAVATAVLVLIAAIVLVFHSPSHTTVTTGATPTTAPATSVAPAGPATSLNTIVPVDSTTTSIPGSQLTLSDSSVVFTAPASSAHVTLSNDGQVATSWDTVLNVSWLTITPPSGSLEPGAAITVALLLDRALAPAGSFATVVTFVPSDQAGQRASLSISGAAPTTTTVPATTTSSTSTTTMPLGGAPTIANVAASAQSVQTAPCPGDQVTITAAIDDPNGVASASLRYRLPGGNTGNPAMFQSGDTWSATIPPAVAAGVLTFTVVAVGNEGVSTSSPTNDINVTACPV